MTFLYEDPPDSIRPLNEMDFDRLDVNLIKHIKIQCQPLIIAYITLSTIRACWYVHKSDQSVHRLNAINSTLLLLGTINRKHVAGKTDLK